MNEITDCHKVANIIAFFAIMFDEDSSVWEEIMEINPNYIIEKFERYVLSTKVEHPWGLHPNLRDYRFVDYINKWELELKDE